jgi:hypothetical protein
MHVECAQARRVSSRILSLRAQCVETAYNNLNYYNIIASASLAKIIPREQETPPMMTSTITMEDKAVKADKADISKKAMSRKNSIDDAIKRTIPVVDAEQAVSFWP